MKPDPRRRFEVRVTAFGSLACVMDLDVPDTCFGVEFGQMRRHPIVPAISCSPIEERSIEADKLRGRRWFPAGFRVVIIQHDDSPALLCHPAELPKRDPGSGNPLQRSRRVHDVEFYLSAQVQRVSRCKLQIWQIGIRFPSQLQQTFIPVDPDNATATSDTLRNSPCNCARSATHIEHGHTRLQQFRQDPVVRLQGPPIQDSGRGLMRLLCHESDCCTGRL